VINLFCFPSFGSVPGFRVYLFPFFPFPFWKSFFFAYSGVVPGWRFFGGLGASRSSPSLRFVFSFLFFRRRLRGWPSALKFLLFTPLKGLSFPPYTEVMGNSVGDMEELEAR